MEPESRSRWFLGAAMVTWIAVMVCLQQLRLSAGYHAEHEDDALYHQMLYLVGEGRLFANTILPYHRPNHLSFTYLALWPLYAFMGGGWLALHVLKACIMASGAVAVCRLARLGGAPAWAGAAWGVVYLAYPPVIVLTLGTVRPLALAVPVLLWLLDAFVAKKFRPFLVWLVVALLTREDLALSAMLLVSLAVVERRSREWIIWPSVLCVGWFLVATRIVLPAMMPAGYWDQIVAENVSQSLVDTFLMNPLQRSHLLGLAALLLPLALLPLGRREVLFGAVGIAAFAINWRPLMPNLTHLAAPAVAAFVGAAALIGGASRRRLAAVCVCLLLAHVQPWIPPTLAVPPEIGGQVAWTPFHPAYHRCDPLCEAQVAALASIPRSVPVTVTGQLLGRFTPRTTLYEYGHERVPFLSPEWIVLQEARESPSTFIAITDLKPHLQLLRGTHSVMTSSRGIVVLRRHSPAPEQIEDAIRALIVGTSR